jgi:unsaturated rhamnogalacturonyl hydrolase
MGAGCRAHMQRDLAGSRLALKGWEHRMTRTRLVRSLLAGGVAAAVAATVAIVVPASAASTLYEAESATVSQGTVDSDHTGFTGTGFVNYDNVTGSYVEFTVSAAQAQSASLVFRFANGTTTNRPMNIVVNGSTVGSAVTFGGTGSWTTWKTQTLTATLVEGDNTIRAIATTSNGGPNLDSLSVDGQVEPPPTTPPPGTDWAKAVADSAMARETPAQFGSWGYPQALTLWGIYLVYQRTHEAKYLTYIRAWADRFVGSDGSISQSFGNLDSMQGGNILVLLYKETGQAKYKTAATKIRTRLNTYPTTNDGGWWHSTSASRKNQLWGDGVFMVLPFLVRYGEWVGDASYANSQAPKQLEIYFSHLRDNNLNLLRHAWAQDPNDPAATWANKTTGQAPESWCRAAGWFGMATTEVLEVIPPDSPDRQQLVDIVKWLVTGYAKYQDPATGRWFQVVDKGSRSDNWTETSCSSMYTYVISRAVERGYVDASYKAVATKGYQGVLAKVSKGSDGLVNISDICEGTNVGNYSYYIGRQRLTNDKHGLGAFLIMADQLRRVG